MAERFNDIGFLSINGSNNLVDHLASVPMLDDGMRAVPLTPRNGYSRQGAILHDAVFTCELYADDDANSVTSVVLGDDFEAIRGKEVTIQIQDTLSSGGTAGTASATDPITELKGKCFSIPSYPGGGWEDTRRYVLAFNIQDKPTIKTS